MLAQNTPCTKCGNSCLLAVCVRCLNPQSMNVVEAQAVPITVQEARVAPLEEPGIVLRPFVPEENSKDANLEIMRLAQREGYIKIDMDLADKFLASETAQDTFTGLKSYYVGQSYFEILTRFLMKYVERDTRIPELGWCKPVYSFCKIGKALINAKIIKGARQYAKEDPFTLPTMLNDLLTGRLYRNWDDSAAYQRFMRSLTKIPEAQVILDEFLTNKAQLLHDIAAHYYGKGYDPDQKYTIKTLLHMLSMDGLLNNWRKIDSIDPKKTDHAYV